MRSNSLAAADGVQAFVGLALDADASGIDAVQFEFGVKYRQEAELDATIKRAARSIVVFYDAYLKRSAN